MNGKFYIITFKSGGGEYRVLDEIEYTEKEANGQLRKLKKEWPGVAFRKKCVYNGPIQVLSARRVAR